MRGIVFLLAVLSAACATHTGKQADAGTQTLPETEFRVVRNLTYSPEGWPQELRADVYLPRGSGPFPAVLVVHGGGWEGRSPEDMAGVSERLASQGFVAVNISYRFAPVYQFPAQLHDVQQAMHWIQRNAQDYNIDRAQVAALGYSAGAHLVSLLGVVAGSGGELDSPYGGPETKPYAVVAGGTPSDLRKFTGGTLVPQFLGGTIEQIPDTFAAASPVVHVHDGAPPFFLYHGGADLLVSDDHATDFRARLEEAGVYTELYLLKWRGHLTAFATSGSAIDEAMQFLLRAKD